MKQFNLTLRFVAPETVSFIQVSGDSFKWVGKLGQKFRSFLKYLENKSNLTILTHSEIGEIAENNSWTGMIGMLERNEVDSTLVPLFIFNNMPIKLSPLQTTTRTHIIGKLDPRYKIQTTIKTFNNFTLSIWISILFTIIVASLVFNMGSSFSFTKNLFSFYRYFINQGYMRSRKWHWKFMILTISFGAMILCIKFSNLMSTGLVTIDDSNIINSFSQLDQQNIVPVVLEIDSFTMNEIRSETSNYPIVRERVAKYKTLIRYYEFPKIIVFFEKYKDKRVVLVMDNIYAEGIIARLCLKNLWVSKESVYEMGIFFWFSHQLKGLEYKLLIKFSYQFAETGLVQEFVTYGTKLAFNADDDNSECFFKYLAQITVELSSIDITNIRTILFVLIAIYFFCIIFGLKEISLCRKAAKKLQNFIKN